jgi:zinc transporter
MLDTVENSGLISGYRIDGEGQATELLWDDAEAALADEASVIWLHFNLADARARDRIQSIGRIPESAKALLLGRDSHMRIEVTGGGLAGVVGDLHHDDMKEGEHFGVLRLYLDSHCLISARSRPLQSMQKLRQEVDGGLKVPRPVAILAHFLHHVTDTLSDLLVELTNDVDDLEEELLAGKLDCQVPELGRIRRIAVRLRRHMVPQTHALTSLLTRLPPWVGEDGARDLRAAIERLAALGHDLDLVQERARLVGDQRSGRLMEATNRNLYILSIVTTIFLPMTLITGIFGMNLGGLPWQSHPQGFWIGIAIMVGLGAFTWWMLRRSKLF